jgi:hypothetical protein
VTPDHCPLCGANVALLRRPEGRSEDERLRARITTLRDRAAQLARGDITPRSLKDEVLWMCAGCRHLIAGTPHVDGPEVQQRIHEEVRTLERRRTLAARAS